MGYVALNESNRVTAHSSQSIEALNITVEVDNEELIDSIENKEMTDFLYASGSLTYSPPDSKLIAIEVAQLKANLAATDYIACKIAEGSATKEEYAQQIAQRQAWRERINELEN